MGPAAPADKVISLTESIAMVRSGECLALGGVQMARRPFGWVRQVLSSDLHDLQIITHSVSIDTDLLLADGRVAALRHQLPAKTTLGPPPSLLRAESEDDVRILRETGATLASGLRATLAGMAFFPMRHTDLGDVGRSRSDLVVMDCPYSGAPVIAIPPLPIDIAVIHVNAAERSGRARIDAAVGLDQEMALAAKSTIIVAEEIVDDIGSSGLQISARHVDAVVELPYGAFPSACLPRYKWDLGYVLSYYDAVREGQFEAFRETLTQPSYDQFLAQARLRRELRTNSP
jgi:glutaconate CoA-transferase subunit A